MTPAVAFEYPPHSLRSCQASTRHFCKHPLTTDIPQVLAAGNSDLQVGDLLDEVGALGIGVHIHLQALALAAARRAAHGGAVAGAPGAPPRRRARLAAGGACARAPRSSLRKGRVSKPDRRTLKGNISVKPRAGRCCSCLRFGPCFCHTIASSPQ